VEGEEGLGPTPRPELVGPLLTNLPNALLDAVRMGFLHSSRAKGRVPAVLRAAADVRFVGMEGDGSEATLLRFQAPTFEAVTRELFQQPRLWDDAPEPHETAFELLGAALDDVAERRTDSDRFDAGLLRRISRYRYVLRRGIRRITLPDSRLPRPAHVDEAVVNAASELVASTPSPRRVRVVGRLDVMGASQSVLKLQVRPGQIVTARWEGGEPVEELRGFFNRDIVIEGVGVFRPSGLLLRIDADAIGAASASEESFRRVPLADGRRDYPKLVRLKPGEESGYARPFGSIPAEESDDEFLEAVEACAP
jgi:hypothetical protein